MYYWDGVRIIAGFLLSFNRRSLGPRITIDGKTPAEMTRLINEGEVDIPEAWALLNKLMYFNKNK